MSQTANALAPCPYCGFIHLMAGVCPRVKAFEYHPNGTIKRVEFHEPQPVVSAATFGPNVSTTVGNR